MYRNRDEEMDGAKIRGSEISKGAIAVIWVWNAEGLNQGTEKPEPRYAERWIEPGDDR